MEKITTFFGNLFNPPRDQKKEKLKKTDIPALDSPDIPDIELPSTAKERIFLERIVEENNLKNQLEELKNTSGDFNLNNNLKQRLKEILLKNYKQFMENKQYLDATHRAEEMLKLEIENTTEYLEKKKLLKNSLVADYEQLILEKNNLFANQRIEKLEKLFDKNFVEDLIKETQKESKKT
ncbi:MAG: hypothetical protein V1649_02690 [Patescibacteria group bacterium]